MLRTQQGSVLAMFTGERRSGQRFKLRLPCRLSSLEARFDDLPGTTVDISRTGVLVDLGGAKVPKPMMQIGEPVRVLIELPHSANFPTRCMECYTTVARVVQEGVERPAVAFEIRRIRVTGPDGEAVESLPFARLPIRGPLQ